MSSPRASIPDQIRDRQVRASDPQASVFVSANAGSGKTYVLVQRVIRLLLAGVLPEKILCITFTKAAAANMSERVFGKLSQWVTLDDGSLAAALRETGIARPDAPMLARARELFACALETPGGLKVQTIHALCTRLLQQFPFESNVPAGFTVLDDRDQNEMLERASLDVLLDAAADLDSARGRALATAMTSAADVTFREVIREASLSRDTFLASIAQAGSLDNAIALMSRALGVAAGDTLAAVDREIVDGPHLPHKDWQRAADKLLDSGASDRKQADKLLDALPLSGTEQVLTYLGVFLTDKQEPRKTLVTKAIADAHPALARAFANEAERIGSLLERRRGVAIRDRTQALLIIAAAVADNYRAEKQARGLLDYDDLIDHTLAMLERGASGWVHYKLDRGIDHVLIDEAQDTSPRQWDIVAHLITEFTSGAGARGAMKRTIFAVGDEKQSIFSFQGAVPREFDARRRLLQMKFTEAGQRFDPVAFNTSFRSGRAILQSVDHVFREPDIYRSIHADSAYPVHESLGDAGPSLIDLWDLTQPDKIDEIEGWRAPLDAMSVTSPEVRLAARVRDEIQSLIAQGAATGPRHARRRLGYGDMLVLVRRRGKAFDAVIQALKHAGVPVAGADRLMLTEHVAIIDLMNLADALLMRRDDLALAVALKSPLFGLDEDDLYKIAASRGRRSLRTSLRTHAVDDPKLLAAHRRLEACEVRAARLTPFAFFAWLLGGDGGRARILKRLGPEANDALDEFLELALAYERKAPASLQGFMAWLRAADTEIKRDMEISRDEVRVMTVHGAKGLEASVVFLVDTTVTPQDSQRVSLVSLPQGNAAPGAPGVMVWAGRKADDPAAVAAARARELAEVEDEYRRLLYVAMTRAADRLIIGGVMPGNRNQISPSWWYDLMARGLRASGLSEQRVTTGHGEVTRFTRADDDALPPPQEIASAPMEAVALPTWLRTPARREAPAEIILRPSEMGDDEAYAAIASDLQTGRADARQRGILVHRLLQSLPDVPADQRRAAAMHFLARHAGKLPGTALDALADQVCALIARADFADMFAPASRAEVSIAGRVTLPRGQRAIVSGQIDRLVVTPEHVLIVDYKTSHVPPSRAADAPQAYVRQLALYRAVLAKLYPQPIRAALLWTEIPEIMEVPGEMLDVELARIISP